MTTQMGLTEKEAECRIFGNDMVNAKFIKENTDLDQHNVLRSEWSENVNTNFRYARQKEQIK